MDFTSVPIIVVCCYIAGELYKWIFRTKTEAYKRIPILSAVLGGALGVLIYLTEPEMIFGVENAWIALGLGIFSGLSATGTNQIIKQLFDKKEETNENKEKKDE